MTYDGLLFNKVWPEPDQEILAQLRRAIPSQYTLLDVVVGGSQNPWAYIHFNQLGEIRLGSINGLTILTAKWPRNTRAGAWILPEDVDRAWAAASMVTAAIQVKPEPVIQDGLVAYKGLYSGWHVRYPDSLSNKMPPRRIMPPARCEDQIGHSAPNQECSCGYHAAYRASELCASGPYQGVIIVTPIGLTYWHNNAWRSESYQVHAAVVGLNKEIPYNWDQEIPVVRAQMALIPARAHGVAREVGAMLSLDLDSSSSVLEYN